MSHKIFALYPEDRDLLHSIDLSALVDLIPVVKTQPDQIEDRAPLRLKIPNELETAIRRIYRSNTNKTDHKYLHVLLTAARHYRAEHPIDDNWNEPDRDSYTETERNRRKKEEAGLSRKTIILRLPSKDRELLLNLGRGRHGIVTRHEALCELVPIIKSLDNSGAFEKIKKHNRKSCRIDIPDELEAAIARRISNNEPFLTILLAAARLIAKAPD
ncbi:MAG: hypothetical protein WC919_04180 [Candidatus Paceibacterota bacterium]|jgi:hypothetical protein